MALKGGHILVARTNVRSHDENLDLLLACTAISCKALFCLCLHHLAVTWRWNHSLVPQDYLGFSSCSIWRNIHRRLYTLQSISKVKAERKQHGLLLILLHLITGKGMGVSGVGEAEPNVQRKGPVSYVTAVLPVQIQLSFPNFHSASHCPARAWTFYSS